MSDRLDDLLGELASGSGAKVSNGLEAAVWRRVEAADRLRSGVARQCAIGACALLIGFSYHAYERAAPPPPRDPGPSLRLLDGSTVAEAGNF